MIGGFLFCPVGPGSDELAKAGNSADNGVHRLIACLFLGKTDGFLGNAGDFPHAKARTHKLGAETHHTANEVRQEAATLDLRYGFFRTRNCCQQLLHLIGRAFLLQEGEDHADCLFCRCRINANVRGDARDQFFHETLPKNLTFT
ncbi:hypothetical protein DK52_3278 [Brucella abortus]|nr:hypothetical protein DK52_3278 [Brucella abortus]